MGRQEGTSAFPGSNLVAPLCAERGANTSRDQVAASASACLPRSCSQHQHQPCVRANARLRWETLVSAAPHISGKAWDL